MTGNVKLEPSWLERLADQFDQPYMHELREFLDRERRNGGFFPPAPLIFNAFQHTPFEAVKVVVLGQDPYHDDGQAMGLSFSVPEGVSHPPSLRNIFKERESDIGMPYPQSGDLTPWAKRGVLLLNSTLTVRPHEARSHHGQGWERFTQAAIDRLASEREGLVFLLWGRDAQERGERVSRSRHSVFESVHPSPLSAHRGFFGSAPFSKANHWLAESGLGPVDWSL